MGLAGDPIQIKPCQHRTPDYRVYFTKAAGPEGCLVKGCRGRAKNCTNLWIHFVHRYMRYKIVILDEGNRPHPRFLACDMFVPWEALNCHNSTTELCMREEYWKKRRVK